MKKILATIVCNVLLMSPYITPYIITTIIAVLSTMISICIAAKYGYGTIGLSFAFSICAITFGICYCLHLKIAGLIIDAFTSKGQKYVAAYMMRFIQDNYAKATLTESTKTAALSFLHKYAKDGLTEHEKTCLQNDADMRMFIDIREKEERTMKAKKMDIVMEYTRMLFCGRVENYDSLDYSMRILLLTGKVQLKSEKLIQGDNISKSDIRVFCTNVQIYSGIAIDTLARFQKLVFANWFQETPLESLVSNFSKTGASKLPRVTDTNTLEDIIDNIKS